jgi:hypothetical protein
MFESALLKSDWKSNGKFMEMKVQTTTVRSGIRSEYAVKITFFVME